MARENEIIKSNLLKYPCIDCYFGDIVCQRLNILDYEHGVLTAELLDPDQETISNLNKLDSALRLGNRCCRDFQLIFQGQQLGQDHIVADAKILDLLAEVKAVEYLYSQDFGEITHIKRQQGVRTVDFTTKRNSQYYAVEVTRLGSAESNKKKTQYHTLHKSPELYQIDLILAKNSRNKTELNNTPAIEAGIHDAIKRKHPQIKAYCDTHAGNWKGILIISAGWDYFLHSDQANRPIRFFGKTTLRVLKKKWRFWQERHKPIYPYLHHVVIVMGKDLAKAITYPSL